MKNECKILVLKPEVKRSLQRLGVVRSIILIVQTVGSVMCGLDLIASGKCSTADALVP